MSVTFKKCLAELIATFTLVFCGTGAIMVNEISNGAIGHLGIAMCFGLVVAVMVYAVGEISGAHMNPAVTVAFKFAGVFPSKDVAPYILAQLTGAIMASGVLRLLFPDCATMGETLPSGSIMQSFILEIILSFFLMFVIINVATGSKETGLMAGLAIGMVVGLDALFGGPISGASMNPARSIAPAIFAQNFSFLWAYIVAPTIGCLLAVVSWNIIKN